MFKKTEKVEEVVVSEENKEGSDENNEVNEHGGLANDEKEPDDETKEKYLSELVERKKTEDELKLKMSEIKVENNGEEPEELKESVFKKCQAMPFPYLESTEIEMRLREENSKLFGEGEDKSLILAKLYEKFKQDVEKYKPEQFEDNFRSKDAHAYGGMNFNNPVITSLIRSAGYEVIKQIGKKILSGSFNLTTISFPIKVMIPVSILQSVARSFFQFPYFMHLASESTEMEKMKYVICASISSYFCSCYFMKPLNPILGETYEAIFSDGTQIYLEQSSHHPPVSSFELHGPNKEWYHTGYSSYKSGAGLNSASVKNNGKRRIEFKDGTIITFGNSSVRFIITNLYL
jgi:hypothetical protein